MHKTSQYRIGNSPCVIGLVVFWLLFFLPIERPEAKASTSNPNSLPAISNLLEDQNPIPAISDLLEEGFAYKRQQQWEKMYEAFSKVLQREKSSYPALIGRGEASYRLNEFDKGLSDANHAIHIQPNTSFGYILRAMILGDMGHFQKALDDATQAIALEDFVMGQERPMLFRGRALLYIKLENPPQALKDIDYAFSLGDRSSKVFQLKAMALSGLTRYQEALENYSKSLDINSKNMESLFGRGAIYNCLGEFSNALQDMTTLLGQDSTYVEAHIERGLAYLGLNDSTAALSDIDAALKEGGQDSYDYLALGHMYFKLNQISKALEMTQRSIEVSSRMTRTVAYFQKGYFLLHSKSFTEAKASYAEGINLIQDSNFNFAVLISILDAIDDLEDLLDSNDPQEMVSTLLQQLKNVLATFPPYPAFPYTPCVG